MRQQGWGKHRFGVNGSVSNARRNWEHWAAARAVASLELVGKGLTDILKVLSEVVVGRGAEGAACLTECPQEPR